MIRNMAARDGQKFLASKLTKQERRLLKKQSKKLMSLKNKNADGLEISEVPTSHLVVGNGGLLCGMNRSSLLGLFGKYGTVKSLCMIPGKEFALISFKTKSDATEAYGAIHGRPLSCPDEIGKEGVVLYLAYLMESFNERVDLLQWNVRPVMPWQIDLHPPGIIITEDFVSKEEETELIRFFKIGLEDSDHDENKSMKHRKVKHYGYEFIYGKNNVDPDNPLAEGIPEICKPIIGKMIHKGLVPWEPNQLTVNQYEVGQGIPPHIDTHSAFEDGIISLSLGSQVVMEFCHPDGKELSLILPPRSLLIMKGESRYLWTHGITPRKTDIVLDTAKSGIEGDINALTLRERGFRLSLTFRKILRGSCLCKFPAKCDSQGFKSEVPMDKLSKETIFVPQNDSEAQKLECDHVYGVYDSIADHFSDTRHSPWPKVADFLQRLPPFSLVADVGCGNGKYLGVNKNITTFGSDRSINLINICRERGHCAIVSDILSLPYRSNSFDACVSIAVIHHLSTEQRRVNAIKEIMRIVKPDGLVLIYVWAQEQPDDLANSEKTSDTSNCKISHSMEGSATEISSEESCRQGQASKEVEKLLKTNGEGNTALDVTMGKKLEREVINSSKDNRTTIEINETRNVFKQQDLLIPWHFRGKQEKEKTGNKGNKSRESFLPSDKIYHRFYHVFVEGELEKLCSTIDCVSIVRSYHDKGNWCIILTKSPM